MKILITGGTGFIGSSLTQVLLTQGHDIIVFCRKVPNKRIHAVRYCTEWQAVGDVEIIVNLAGEPLNTRRWSVPVKQRIYDSRINMTKHIINFIEKSTIKPILLISGSAIGFYGDSLSETFTEDSKINPDNFTQNLCHEWEAIANKARAFNVRVCTIRTGIVLGSQGGLLKTLLPAAKMGLLTQFGNGEQWMSWIHIKDVVSAIQYLISNSDLSGAFNLTSPSPVTQATLFSTLAKNIKRPFFLRLSSWIVSALFGEMGRELLLKGQRVLPKKLKNAGYCFQFEELDAALKDILKKESK